MKGEDRRFTSWLFIVFGPLFVLGGFLAAFTDAGAVLVFTGAALLVAGLLLRTRLPAPAAFAAGLVTFAALAGQLAADRLG